MHALGAVTALSVSSEAFCAALLAAVKRIPSAQRTARFDALALDFHPWEDTLNLSLHAIDEQAPLMLEHGVALADWRLAHFALAQETDARAWPEGRVISTQLSEAFARTEWESADACMPFFEDTLSLCDSAALYESLRAELSLAEGFRILLPHADTSRWYLSLRWTNQPFSKDGVAFNAGWMRERWTREVWTPRSVFERDTSVSS